MFFSRKSGLIDSTAIKNRNSNEKKMKRTSEIWSKMLLYATHLE